MQAPPSECHICHGWRSTNSCLKSWKLRQVQRWLRSALAACLCRRGYLAAAELLLVLLGSLSQSPRDGSGSGRVCLGTRGCHRGSPASTDHCVFMWQTANWNMSFAAFHTFANTIRTAHSNSTEENVMVTTSCSLFSMKTGIRIILLLAM